MTPDSPATPIPRKRIFQMGNTPENPTRKVPRFQPSEVQPQSYPPSSASASPSIPKLGTNNPFLRTTTPKSTPHRSISCRGSRSGIRDLADADSDDSDDMHTRHLTRTPISRRSQHKSSLSIHVGPFGGGNTVLNSASSSRLSLLARRNSDAMVMNMLTDDAFNLDPMAVDGTPRKTGSRRSSLSALSAKPLNRIANLLKDEAKPFDKEIAHEKAVNQSFPTLHSPFNLESLELMLEESPPDSPSMMDPSTPRSDRAMSVSLTTDSRETTPENLGVPVPVRAVAIPNSALKDPATYVSHSSKLNPENSFISKQQEAIMSSPSLSPVHMMLGGSSPSASERKGKRKLSGDTDRFEPYKRIRMPSSPTVHSPTYAASYFPPMGPRTGSTPPPFSLPFPLVFQRQRSPSVSSTSSGSGNMWGVEKTGGTTATGDKAPNSNSSSNGTPIIGHALHTHLASSNPPPSPKTLGQMLNLTGTQEGFTKMSITE
ncbi:hypothetical protein SpCBS45565_g04521 [Spizellomyces sp. 'palustris']|nr:hypothetical protein SpCBS45565_g04521 [Spizellomyces sp. 'palustris']